MSARRRGASVLLAALAACGGAQAPAENAPPAPPPPPERVAQGVPPSLSTRICTEVVRLQCAGNATCCRDPSARHASEAECVATLGPLCVRDLEGAAFEDDRIRLDEEALGRSLAALRSAVSACTPLGADLWRGVFVGTLAAGADCTPTEDGTDFSPLLACAPGHACTGGEGDAGHRTCTPHAAQGVRCADAECAPGLYCDAGRRPRCRALGADRARCAAGHECESGLCERRRCAPRPDDAAWCGDFSYP